MGRKGRDTSPDSAGLSLMRARPTGEGGRRHFDGPSICDAKPAARSGASHSDGGSCEQATHGCFDPRKAPKWMSIHPVAIDAGTTVC